MRFARVSESQKMVIIYQIIYWTINVFYSIHGERENSWMNATLLKERERERGKLKKWLFVTFVWYSLTNLFKSEQIYKKVQKVVNHFWSFYTLSHTLFCTHTHIFSHSLTCTHTHSHFLSLSHSHTHTQWVFLSCWFILMANAVKEWAWLLFKLKSKSHEFDSVTCLPVAFVRPLKFQLERSWTVLFYRAALYRYFLPL